MTKGQIGSVTKEEANVRTERHGETDVELGKISGGYLISVFYLIGIILFHSPSATVTAISFTSASSTTVLSAMMRTTAFSATSVPMFHSTATFVVRALRRFLSFLKAPHPLYVPVFDFSRARVEKVPDSSHLYHREHGIMPRFDVKVRIAVMVFSALCVRFWGYST
jgi:hypothetical protein